MSQTAVFRQLVRDHMRRTPVLVSAGTRAAEAVRQMAAAAADSILVVSSESLVQGIVTEQDVTRRLAFRLPGDVAVDEVMTTPVRTVRERDYLYHAIAYMRRSQLRHMPVVDDSGRVVGLLNLHEALAVASAQLVELVDRLTHEDTLDGLKQAKAAQVEVADALFNDNVPALEIQALLSDINLDIYRHIVTLSLRGMCESGWGEPPVEFAVIVMGSGGRGESHLLSDQDNGFILANYPDDQHLHIDPYFIELARRMTKGLDAVGIPMCRGNVMATCPIWRKTISHWRHQIDIWMRQCNDVAIQLADVFFDFRPAVGPACLSRELRRHITRALRNNPGFLREMYSVEAAHEVALGWFGRLRTERHDSRRGDFINLKHHGTLPLIGGVRLLALRAGVTETATLGRIDALHVQGVLDANEHDYLCGAFRLMTDLLLRQQIADCKAGRPVSNLVPTATLSKREKAMLADCFRAITTFRERVRFDLTGEIF